MKKLSENERAELWLRLMKKDKSFEDLCDERNKIVRLIEDHQILTTALFSELNKWDFKLGTVFENEIQKEITLKIKK